MQAIIHIIILFISFLIASISTSVLSSIWQRQVMHKDLRKKMVSWAFYWNMFLSTFQKVVGVSGVSCIYNAPVDLLNAALPWGKYPLSVVIFACARSLRHLEGTEFFQWDSAAKCCAPFPVILLRMSSNQCHILRRIHNRHHNQCQILFYLC